jgi:hypothetical protein
MNKKIILFILVVGFIFVGGVVAGVNYLGDSSQTGSGPAENSTVTPQSGSGESTTATPRSESTEIKTSIGDDGTEVQTNNTTSNISINESVLESEIEDGINEYRCDEVTELGCSLKTEGGTAETLDLLAQNHSQVLLERGGIWYSGVRADHDFGGLYKHYGVYSTCQYKVDSYVATAQDGSLMSVWKVNVSSGDESAIAETVLDNWEEIDLHGTEYNHDEASSVGVGVAVDNETNEGYVTSAVC